METPMADFPEIPVGKAMLLPADVHLLRGGDDPAGVLVNSEGRLALVAGSVGLGVVLSADDAAALAATLWGLSHRLARQERGAAADADALLERAAQGAMQ
jgi:hypothetical protein